MDETNIMLKTYYRITFQASLLLFNNNNNNNNNMVLTPVSGKKYFQLNVLHIINI